MLLPNATTPQLVTPGALFTWTIAAAQVGSLVVPHEIFGGTTRQLYLRISINDGSMQIPAVQVNAGGADTLILASGQFSVYNSASVDVGVAEFISRTATELLIRFSFSNDSPGIAVGSFSLGIQVTDANSGAGSFRYVGVAAGLAADTLRPWIHIEPNQGQPAQWNAGKRLLINETAELQVVIKNLGTGPLQMTAPADPLNGTFAVQNVASLVLEIPARGSTSWTVVVTAGASGGENSFSWQLASDDTEASPGSGHNADITLSASWGKLEVVFVLDASGSMAWDYEGNPPSSGESTRWDQLYNSVGAFFTELQNIAADGKGQCSVILYPDRTHSPVTAATTFLHVDRADITETFFADSVDTQLAGSTLPFSDPVEINGGGTAITNALGIGTGPTVATYGRFDSSNDAKTYNHRFVIVMTDGENNAEPPLTIYYDDVPGGLVPRSNWLVDKRINLIAIPYGPNATARAELAQIAIDQTDASAGVHGTLLDPADELGSFLGEIELTNAFKKALGTSLNLEFTADPVAQIPPMHVFVHEVLVTPYDRYVTFSVASRGFSSKLQGVAHGAVAGGPRLEIELIRPDGQVFTLPELMQLSDVRVASAAANLAITLTAKFLGDRTDASNLNMGAWKLRIRNLSELQQQVVYHVSVQSALRLSLNYESGRAWAGENLDVEATLDLFGRSLTGASVVLEIVAPNDSSINWLAGQPMTGETLQIWKELMDSRGDYTGISAKHAALARQGILFAGSSSTNKIIMHDTNGDGVYRATVPNTALQGSYKLYVTAIGSTADGVQFRRERGAGVVLVPRPDPKYSIFALDFDMIDGGVMQATVRYKPLDAAGNVILFDPAFSQRVIFHVEGATWTGPMLTEWDGMYTQTMRFPAGDRPSLDVTVDGQSVVLDLPIPSISDLAWACQALLHKGHEAKPGANRHSNPNAAEGNPYKGRRDFVSLGGGGSLYIMPDRVCPHMRSITVVVEPDVDLRAYKVEVLTVPSLRRCWVEVGRSQGVTQTFDLGELRRRHIFGIRITDLSNRTRNPDLTPSATPGVSIRGVGFEPGRRRWEW
jgi:hypothetical protein